MFKLARIGTDIVFHAVLLCTIGVALDLADSGVLVGYRDRRGGLVRLTGRPVHRHHPQVTFVLVVRSVYYIVAFAHSVEKVPVGYTQLVTANCANVRPELDAQSLPASCGISCSIILENIDTEKLRKIKLYSLVKNFLLFTTNST